MGTKKPETEAAAAPTIKGQVADIRDDLARVRSLPLLQQPGALMRLAGDLLNLVEAMADKIEGGSDGDGA